jgi:AcrR family transcriptional regulator
MASISTIVSNDGRLRRGERSRELILIEAMKLASIDGVDGLSLGAVARAASTSKSNISVLFGDKSTLQIRTLEAAAHIFNERVVVPFEIITSPKERLQKTIFAWFDYVGERVFPGGCLLVSSLHEFRAKPGPLQEMTLTLLNNWSTTLTNLICAAQLAGELEETSEPYRLAQEVIALQSLANIISLHGDQERFELVKSIVKSKISSV